MTGLDLAVQVVKDDVMSLSHAAARGGVPRDRVRRRINQLKKGNKPGLNGRPPILTL